MKNIITLAVLFISLKMFAQVGINNTSPKATLDITAKTTDGSKPEGIIVPRLAASQFQSATYGSNQTGTLIYATESTNTNSTVTAEITEPGFYYFNGTKWKKINSSGTTISYTTIADPNILGYVPSNAQTATTAPNNLAVGSTTSTKVSTGNFGGHSYAAYSSNGAVSWYDAYNAAKSMGGYLVTFTSDAEWQYVETNLLTPYSAFNTNGAWIGMCKFSWFAGSSLTPDPEFKWITGEQPNHDYSAGGTGAVRKSNWFASGEPNNNGGNEGFVHIWYKNQNITKTYNGYTSTHPWNDVSADNTSWIGSKAGFIVEFQQ